MPDTPEHALPIVLIIRDGWGENPNSTHNKFNAIHLAETPVDDRLRSEYPSALIQTSGENVGLPAGTMGNSEVGHQNIGAGRIVDQEIMRITNAIQSGDFFQNIAMLGAFQHARHHDGNMHLLGLVSDGKVHSDIEHLFAMIDFAQAIDFPGDRLFVHAITDGRDTGPKTGLDFIRRVEKKLAETACAGSHGRIASVIGRYYAMDRDHRWARVAWAYDALTAREAGHPTRSATSNVREAESAVNAIEHYYDNPTEESLVGDEFVMPTRIAVEAKAGDSAARITDGDAVIFFNFRGDRPRELSRAFVLDDDAWAAVQDGGFNRGERIGDLFFCTMTGYEEGLPVSAVAFGKPQKMPDILGEVISRRGLTQLRAAETEKFPHVTFFFNDYREEPFEGEARALTPSPTDVSTYDQRPEMSACEVCESVIARLKAEDCESMIIVNFANGDMVGHTGNLDATVKAIQTVDECVGRIVDAVLQRGGSLIVTADHGNAEQMWDPDHNAPHTAHTTYDVPLILIGEQWKEATIRQDGKLGDIAPTILHMMGLNTPQAMAGQSLTE